MAISHRPNHYYAFWEWQQSHFGCKNCVFEQRRNHVLSLNPPSVKANYTTCDTIVWKTCHHTYASNHTTFPPLSSFYPFQCVLELGQNLPQQTCSLNMVVDCNMWGKACFSLSTFNPIYISAKSSSGHCSILLNTYNNRNNKLLPCKCTNNNPITCNCTKKSQSQIKWTKDLIIASND
jgi:hypothetical protein